MSQLDAPAAPSRAPFRAAAALGFLSVGMGAFGAHGLKTRLTSSGLDPQEILKREGWWETAAQYHLVHAVALAAAAAALAFFGRSARPVTWCFSLGIAVFSGTLYALALGAPSWFGAITPLGGVFLMAGWAALFVGVSPSKARP